MMKKEDLKIALCICPQWSIATPSFALGSLNTALTEAGFNSTQYDINMMSSLYLKNNHKEYFKKWTQDNPWSTKQVFWEEIVPLFQEFWFDIIKELSEYDVVSFTTYSSNIMTTDYLARYLRQINPNIHIWYGGPFCWYGENGGLVESSKKFQTQEGYGDIPGKGKYREFIDIGCGTNEGEKTIVDLATDLIETGSYENTSGIWKWDKLRPSFATALLPGRSGRTPVYTGNLQIMNLNTLSTPTWSEEVLKGYTEIRKEDKTSDFGPKLTVPIQGSRGCTFKCTFCSETRLYRYRSPEKLIEDITKLNKEYGVENFWFTDSLINGSISNYKKFVDVLNDLIDKGELPKIRYGGYFRTHKKMNEKFLDEARKSGLVYMNIGVENGVPKTLALMEKNQTPDVIKMYLDAVTKDDKIAFDAGWIPGYPRETTVDFISSLKFLFDTKHNFKCDVEKSGRINLMKGTDALVDTPLDTERDVFDISKDENLLKNWISNDYRNNIFSRHLRAHLTDLFLNIFKINQRGLVKDEDMSKPIGEAQDETMPKAQSWAMDTSFYNFQSDGSNSNVSDDSIFKNSFLTPSSGESSFKEILINSLIDEVKGFVWLIYSLQKNVNLEFGMTDNFKVFNLKDTSFIININFETKPNSDFNLKVDFKINVDEEDRKYLNIKNVNELELDETFEISGNFDRDYSDNKVVNDLYMDSLNVDKYKINIARTATTGRY